MRGGDIGKLVPSAVLQGIAKASYDNIHKREPPAKIGTWFLFASSPTLILYSNSEVRNKHIDCIVGIRGTQDSTDWEANLTIPFNALINSQRFKEDSEQMEDWKRQIDANIPDDYDVAYAAVGHSLGGALADEFLREGIVSSALTFNAAIQPKDLGMAHEGFDVKRVYSNGDPLYELMGRYADPPPKIIQLDGDLTLESTSVVDYLQSKLARHKIRVFDDVGKGPDTTLLGNGKKNLSGLGTGRARRVLRGGVRRSHLLAGLAFLLTAGTGALGGLMTEALYYQNPAAFAYLGGMAASAIASALGITMAAAARLQEQARQVQADVAPGNPMPFPPPPSPPPVDVPEGTAGPITLEEIPQGMLVALLGDDRPEFQRWYSVDELNDMWRTNHWFNPMTRQQIERVEWRTANVVPQHVAIPVAPIGNRVDRVNAEPEAGVLPDVHIQEGMPHQSPEEVHADARRQARAQQARGREDAAFQQRNARRVAEVEAMPPEEQARRARELEEEAQALRLHGYGREHTRRLLQGGVLSPPVYEEFLGYLRTLPFMKNDPTHLTAADSRKLAQAAIDWIREHSPDDSPRFEAAMSHYIEGLTTGQDTNKLFLRAMASIRDVFEPKKVGPVIHKKEFGAVQPTPSPPARSPKPAASPPASPRVRDVVAAADSGVRLTEALAPRKGLGLTHKEHFLKMLDLPIESHSLKELAAISKVPISTLHKVYIRGIGAYKTQPSSVRLKGSFVKGVDAPMSKKLSKEQWAMARVYSFLDGNPKHDGDLRPHIP
jgi:hypothetical protein